MAPTGPKDSGSPEEGKLPISNIAAQQIAGAFHLTVAEVIANARQVAEWQGPGDELLVWMEHRHLWKARGALAYLLSLRSALSQDGSRDSSA